MSAEVTLWGQLTHLQIVLGGHAKRVGDAIEEGKHCNYVNGFRNLFFAPTCLPQLLHVFVCGAAGGLGDQFGIVEQGALGWGEICVFKLSVRNAVDCFIGCSLNPQEVSVTVDSIGATIEGGNVGSEHLLVTAGEMSLGEVNGV